MENSMAEMLEMMRSMQIQNDSIKSALDENTAAVRDLSTWRPQIDATVVEIKGSLTDLRGKVVAFRESIDPACKVFDTETIDFPVPIAAQLAMPSSEAAQRPVPRRKVSPEVWFRGSHYPVSTSGHSNLAIVNRFIDGLGPAIKPVVFIQKPVDLDTAVSLALLQEEVTADQSTLEPKGMFGFPGLNYLFLARFALAQGIQTGPKKSDYLANFKPSYRPSAALPSSTTKDSVNVSAIPEGRKSSEMQRSVGSNEKIQAMMAYRKAKGLCYKCGLRWGPTHKCAPTVDLHVVEELWQLLTDSEFDDKEFQSESAADLMTVSINALNGTEASKTIRLVAAFQSQAIVMLLDSRSSTSFMCEQLATALPHWVALSHPLQVKVADGRLLWCTHEVQNCSVKIQGVTFVLNLKILPLQCYDVILGIDWLELYSPMEIHWKDKWLAFNYQGSRITLQGQNAVTNCSVLITNSELRQLELHDEIWCMLEVLSLEESSDQQPIPAAIQELIEQFDELFQKPTGLPPVRSHSHAIPFLPGAIPFRLRPYRYNPAQKDEIERQVCELLKNDLIQPSSSPFASPVLLVKKKDGDWRLCVDYRRLNALTVKNKYPLPVIDELLDELAGARWFTSLDLRSGYHQIRMDPNDMYKTAFQTHNGHYEYKVMPYGVTGGPATFQLTMNTYWDHVQHVRAVFSLLKEHHFKIKLTKCSFAQPQLTYLGHIISKNGVATDPAKLKVIQRWPTPTSAKEIETDASDLGIGAVLQQAGHPIAFVSKALGVKNQALSTYEKECLAILMAVDHWRSYLQTSEFILKTDQRSLTHLEDQRLVTPWQQRAMTNLMGLQFKICYKKGTDNRVADALSRLPPSSVVETYAISVLQPSWLQQVIEAYPKYPVTNKLLAALAISSPLGHYELVAGLIRYKGKIVSLHATPVGGHSGTVATYHRIKKLFRWTGMKKFINQRVAECTVCQQAKAERVKYPGLLQPLPVPDSAWKIITMDFIEGLPVSDHADTILVVVDKFSKYSHFIPLKHPFIALTVAKKFMDHVFKLHGFPLAIISDRDRIFTSAFWKELFTLAGVKLQLSSAYHPQTDGQTERRTPFEILYGQTPHQLGIDQVESCAVPDLDTWLKERKVMVQLVQQQLSRAQQLQKMQADKHRTARSFAVGDLVYLKLQPGQIGHRSSLLGKMKNYFVNDFQQPRLGGQALSEGGEYVTLPKEKARVSEEDKAGPCPCIKKLNNSADKYAMHQYSTSNCGCYSIVGVIFISKDKFHSLAGQHAEGIVFEIHVD
ncbi:hypothetical protein U9M48_022759 [Paspalum notatum var. saurae]|uniref:RNA-directed DNA polymerase n=1 Tax=Paspalum notatum var. saurae TaxID=547442 RepID=A0AAQ3TJ60_PASNO